LYLLPQQILRGPAFALGGGSERKQLPAECRAMTRRHLTRLEALERDAIVDALAAHQGDKAAAATALGMSRATIYRKIRDYAIVT
jgi:transcriptional regulator of acetoin/glycerol metabolism